MIMTSDAASIYSVRRLSRRPQFSVLALLLFVTLFCLLLASGVFYFAQQRKERERIAQDLDRLNAEISQKSRSQAASREVIQFWRPSAGN
jgi:Tfp pilus assembly protein PilN